VKHWRDSASAAAHSTAFQPREDPSTPTRIEPSSCSGSADCESMTECSNARGVSTSDLGLESDGKHSCCSALYSGRTSMVRELRALLDPASRSNNGGVTNEPESENSKGDQQY